MEQKYLKFNKEKKYGHALDAGIERAPRKVTKRMS